MNERKLLYILPEYNRDAHTHFSYIPALLREAGNSFSITLLVERGRVSELPGVTRIVTMPRFALLRMIRLPFSILLARLRGAKVAYVHYSFMSAFWASLIFRPTGGAVFYWNCGLPWQYSRSFNRETFERLVYLMVTRVVTGTEGLANRYANEYILSRKKVVVMPNWIDTEETSCIVYASTQEALRKKYNIPDAPYVFYAHRLSERKGAQYLPEIYSLLPADTALVVAGDGPLRTRLDKEAVREGGRENVIFLGWVPHDDVLRLMSYAKVFIMPSDEEGFPHVILEAMAIGTPFVATSVGGMSEIVPKEMVQDLVPKGDMARFNDQLEKVLFMPDELRGHFGADSAQWAQQYDVKLVAKRFEALLAPYYAQKR